jgi:DNA-binding transcriptional MerR regulator
MSTTVRTLQYYDKEGILSPSAQSEGGRRLYTDKDMIKLYQILSMKQLGFSLDDIKNRLTSLDTPADVANALSEQAANIRGQIEVLSEALKEIEMLKVEVLQMQQVDFKRYADIIVNLQMKNEFYWLIKHFDDNTLEHFRKRFDKDSGLAMVERNKRMNDEAIRLQKNGVPPESEEGQEFAKAFWEMIMEFTNGDMSILPKLMEIGNIDNLDNELKQNQEISNSYIGLALDVYFTKMNYNPFEEGSNELRNTD